jgi:hypothetical protein
VPPVAIVRPCGLIAAASTGPEWPPKARVTGLPVVADQSRAQPCRLVASTNRPSGVNRANEHASGAPMTMGRLPPR